MELSGKKFPFLDTFITKSGKKLDINSKPPDSEHYV